MPNQHDRCFDAAFKALELLNSTRPTWNGPIHRAAALLLEATGPQPEGATPSESATSNLREALRARCPGNGDDSDPVCCQSFEASEQSQPCPAGCCVMAEEKDVRSVLAAIVEEEGSATPSAIGTRTDWIPVSERLPKAEYGDTSHSGVKAIISADVLAYFEDGVVRVGNYDHEAQFWHMVSINEPIRSDIDPTHWMPMPGGPHG